MLFQNPSKLLFRLFKFPHQLFAFFENLREVIFRLLYLGNCVIEQPDKIIHDFLFRIDCVFELLHNSPILNFDRIRIHAVGLILKSRLVHKDEGRVVNRYDRAVLHHSAIRLIKQLSAHKSRFSVSGILILKAQQSAFMHTYATEIDPMCRENHTFIIISVPRSFRPQDFAPDRNLNAAAPF